MRTRSVPAQRQGALPQARRDEMASASAALSRLPSSSRVAWRNVASLAGMSLRKAWFGSRRWLRLSADLDSWPCSSAGGEAQTWTEVAWSKEFQLLVAVAKDGVYRSMVSGDGSHWTRNEMPGAESWESVCWSPGLYKFCAVSSSGGENVALTYDTYSWSAYAGVQDGSWRCVCWSQELGLFCAVAPYGPPSIMTSPDGMTWAAQTAPEASFWVSVCWSSELGLFCAVASGGTCKIMTSPDGVTWTGRGSAGLPSLKSVCWSPDLGMFVAVAMTGPYRAMQSYDGVTWTSSLAASLSVWSSVCWSPGLGLFCAVASSTAGNVMTSPDGRAWTSAQTARPYLLRCVCWSPYLAMFIAPVNSVECGSVASTVALKPQRDNGAPLLLGYQVHDNDYALDSVTLALARPAPANWVFELVSGPTPASVAITIPEGAQPFVSPEWGFADSGATETMLCVWFGRPLVGAKEKYGGPWVYSGAVYYARGPWTTEALSYSQPEGLYAGSRLPVRLQFISRGMRFSPVAEVVAVLQ